jgi:hypothetical protein
MVYYNVVMRGEGDVIGINIIRLWNMERAVLD